LSSRARLLAYLDLFAVLYAAFGVQSSYLPSLLKEHGLGAEAIGLALRRDRSGGFCLMAALCAIALPFARRLELGAARRPNLVHRAGLSTSN